MAQSRAFTKIPGKASAGGLEVGAAGHFPAEGLEHKQWVVVLAGHRRSHNTRTTAHCAQSTKSRASSSLPVGHPFKAPRATKKIARRKSTAVEFSTNEGDPGRHQKSHV